MPAKDFGVRGYPRMGQWVLVDGNDSPDIKVLTKFGVIEQATSGWFLAIFQGVDENRRDEPEMKDQILVVPSPRPLKIKRSFNVRVAMVGPKGENVPGGILGTTLDKLTPLLDKNLIPVERRRSMDPGWEPTP